MFDFLILKSKIFTRNEPQVKVTLQLKVPSKHPSHRYSDFILDFKSVITIVLCYGGARQTSLPLFVNSILSFNSTCAFRSENRHFGVALTWSLGRICATDWILKYTPTASRLIQTTDTIHKRLKLDEQCLLGIMRHLMMQRRNFCLSSGATRCHFSS